MVEGAGELAEVAAEDVAPGVEVGRQGTRIVGGVVGRATAYIHHRWPFGCQCVVGAGIDTFPAFGAKIGVHGWFGIFRAFFGGDDFAEVDPSAPAGSDEERVAAYPPEASAGGPVFVADGYGITAHLAVDAESLTQGKKHFFYHLVVFAVLGVGGDFLPLVGQADAIAREILEIL